MSRKVLSLLCVLMLFLVSGDAGAVILTGAPAGGVPGAMRVMEVDGAPDALFIALKFPNGSLTNNGDGSVTIATGTGGPGSTPAPCPTGQALIGESCFDVATQVELNAHIALTDAHGATSSNTPNRMVMRDGSGNFGVGTITGSLQGNAATATAFTTDPFACLTSPQRVVVDIAANGTLTCQQLGFSDLSGVLTDAQIPDLNTLSSGLVVSRCVETDGTGKLGVAAGPCGVSGGSTGITGATNHGIMVATGGTTGASLPVATNGQVPIGSTGGDPILGQIAGTLNQVQITNGPGTIQVGLATNPTLPGTTTGTFSGPLTGNAATATSLAANGTNCPAGQAAQGVDASGNAEGCLDVSASGGAATSAHYVTTQAEAGLSAEANLGALTSGLLKHTVSGGVSAPATATPGTDYPGLDTANVFSATAGQSMKKLLLPGSTSGILTMQAPPAAGTSTITWPAGAIDFSTSGGGSQVVKQLSTGGPFTVGALTSADVGLGNVDNINETTRNSSPAILEAKQIVPRTPACTVSANAVTPNADAMDVCIINALAAGLTINTPTAIGSNPRQSQYLEFRITTAAPQPLAFNATSYSASAGYPLPTLTTGGGAEDYFGFRRNNDTSKWVLVASTQAAVLGVTSLTSSSTYTCPATSNQCEMQMTGATGTVTIAPPSGTAGNGKMLMLRLMCTNTQTVAMTTGAGGFIASPNVPLLTQCPAGTAAWTAMGVIYSSVTNRWQLYATN